MNHHENNWEFELFCPCCQLTQVILSILPNILIHQGISCKLKISPSPSYRVMKPWKTRETHYVVLLTITHRQYVFWFGFPSQTVSSIPFLITEVHLSLYDTYSSSINSYITFKHTVPVDSLQNGAAAGWVQEDKLPPHFGATEMNYTETAHSQ